jgi:hypothetical protein
MKQRGIGGVLDKLRPLEPRMPLGNFRESLMMPAYVDRPRQTEMNQMTQPLICNFPAGCSINFFGWANYIKFWLYAFSKKLQLKLYLMRVIDIHCFLCLRDLICVDFSNIISH